MIGISWLKALTPGGPLVVEIVEAKSRNRGKEKIVLQKDHLPSVLIMIVADSATKNRAERARIENWEKRFEDVHAADWHKIAKSEEELSELT